MWVATVPHPNERSPMLWEHLERCNTRPAPFSVHSAEELWTDPHTSARMLDLHLDGEVAMASQPTGFIDSSLRWLNGLTALDRRSRVLDLGCGPGLYTNRLARTGADVVGVDFSERSIRHAEQAADPTARPTYVLGNYLEVDIAGDFDLVLLAMYDYCALSPDQRRQLLDRIHARLRPGGRFVFDVYAMRSFRDREEAVVYAADLMDGFWSADPYHGFLHTFVYEDHRVVLDRYEIIEATRSRTIYNWLQYFDEEAITDELRSARFGVEQIVGDLTGAAIEPDPETFCVVATPG
ncbi:MAG: class I SAM-dependent methyltransferase [Actinomycetota bacterium]